MGVSPWLPSGCLCFVESFLSRLFRVFRMLPGPLVDLSAANRCELKWMEDACWVALRAAAERLTVTFLSPGLAVTTVLLGLGSLAMTAQCPCSPT